MLYIAQREHPDVRVRKGLVEREYVSGLLVKEPAVKTLNSIIAAMTVDVLVNHYTDRQKHEPVWIYEDNAGKCIYPDRESVLLRSHKCYCNKF